MWRSMHFMGHFMVGAILLIGFVFPPRSPRKAQQAGAVNGSIDGVVPGVVSADDVRLKDE